MNIVPLIIIIIYINNCKVPSVPFRPPPYLQDIFNLFFLNETNFKKLKVDKKLNMYAAE